MKWINPVIFNICSELVFFNWPINFLRVEVNQVASDGVVL